MSVRILQAMCLLVASTVLASVTIQDPSDIIPAIDWAADNAIVANYDIPFPVYQPSDIAAKYIFSANNTSLDHKTYTVDTNDTSVILVSKGSNLDLSFVDVIKYGYSSNLDFASFWGFNAAINVANASTATFDHINITVHNGAANIYAYGTNTTVNVTDAWLYSSGPVAHGLYASGNATIYGANIAHFSGGRRSSSFSGDAPMGTIHVRDSVAHTQGIGSATFYTLGQVYADSVVSTSEMGPAVFMDGAQSVYMANCDSTAGLLGGMVIFSGRERKAGGIVDIRDSRITTTGPAMPGLWFGNTIVDVSLYGVEIETASGILVVANYSQVTQDFDHYAGHDEKPGVQPAEVFIDVAESSLVGDLVAYNRSYISWNLTGHSSWAGAAYSGYGSAYVDVALDATSNWTLTNTSYVQNLTDVNANLTNIHGGGYTLHYNASALLNGWLKNRTIALSGSGWITPGTHP